MASVMGPDGIFATSNAAYRTMVARSGIVGRPVLDVFPALAGRQAVEMLERVRRTGETVAHTGWRFDQDVDGSGELRPFYFDFFATPVLGPDGEVDGVQITQIDVTERVLELRDAEQAAHDRRRRDVAEGVARLQDVLLPTDLPLVPCVDIEARYLLAAGKGAGGDWFDAVVRPDGHVALVVGDVVGHGVGASAVMGQLRAVLHSQLLTRSTLPEALAVLDRYAEREIESRATTVCVLELDADTGQLEYCTAGHPPPLVVTGAGDAQYLEPTGAGPLATGKGFATRRASLADGDLVVMYTDGLVDRPGRTPAESTVQLREVVRESARNAHLRASTSSRPVDARVRDRPGAVDARDGVRRRHHAAGSATTSSGGAVLGVPRRDPGDRARRPRRRQRLAPAPRDQRRRRPRGAARGRRARRQCRRPRKRGGGPAPLAPRRRGRRGRRRRRPCVPDPRRRAVGRASGERVRGSRPRHGQEHGRPPRHRHPRVGHHRHLPAPVDPGGQPLRPRARHDRRGREPRGLAVRRRGAGRAPPHWGGRRPGRGAAARGPAPRRDAAGPRRSPSISPTSPTSAAPESGCSPRRCAASRGSRSWLRREASPSTSSTSSS